MQSKIERHKPKKRKVDKSEEEYYRSFVWGMIDRVRSGYYKIDGFDSIVKQEKENNS